MISLLHVSLLHVCCTAGKDESVQQVLLCPLDSQMEQRGSSLIASQACRRKVTGKTIKLPPEENVGTRQRRPKQETQNHKKPKYCQN